jgi:hypothetical protein
MTESYGKLLGVWTLADTSHSSGITLIVDRGGEEPDRITRDTIWNWLKMVMRAGGGEVTIYYRPVCSEEEPNDQE